MEICPFNVKSLEKACCPPGKQQIYIADPRCKGLYLQVSAGGTKTFVLRRKIDGTYRQKRIGTFPLFKIEEARDRAGELNAALGKGSNPFDDAASLRQEPNFGELFNIYVERHLKKSRKQVVEAERNFENWFLPWAGKKASKLTRTDAERIHAQIGTERGKYAANRAVQLGRAIYNKAKIWQLCSGDNPFASISLFSETPRNRFLTAAETTALLGKLLAHPNADLRDFGVIALFTGARKANIMSMQWSEINLTPGAATWTIPAGKAKNSSAQVIPLGPAEANLLSQRSARLAGEAESRGDSLSDFVFPGPGKSGHRVDVKKAWTTLREQLKISDVTIHDLRRSLASAMASRNIEPQVIRKALNHKDLKTTMSVYALVNGQAERDARSVVHNDWLVNAGIKPADSNVAKFKSKTGRQEKKS